MSEPKPPSPDAVVNEADLYLAFRLMRAKDFEGALTRLESGIEKSKKSGNTHLEGLYLSALGLLNKLKKDYKEAYRCYQQAEKLLPDDASLKIITASLLINEFGQYDTASRKLVKVVETAKDDPATLHHARCLLAMAHIYSGQREKARELLTQIVAEDFAALRSAANVNFRLPQACVAKDFERDLCRAFLDKALALAKAKKEEPFIATVATLLKHLDALGR